VTVPMWRGLLVTDSAVESPRATDDVDAIIEISTLAQYQGFESELRKLGYENDMRDGAPLCRYVHGTFTLDVMATANSDSVGFIDPNARVIKNWHF